MEKSKKELIEKLNLIHKLLAERRYKNARTSLGALIFSINSDAQVESPTVGDNEHQEKDCHPIMHMANMSRFGYCDLCGKCNVKSD